MKLLNFSGTKTTPLMIAQIERFLRSPAEVFYVEIDVPAHDSYPALAAGVQNALARAKRQNDDMVVVILPDDGAVAAAIFFILCERLRPAIRAVRIARIGKCWMEGREQPCIVELMKV